MLNAIELAWAGLKSYVREHNTSFRFGDVRRLTQTWMTALDASTAVSYLNHAQNIEATFKKSDRFTEEIEEHIIEGDNDDDEEQDEMNSDEEEENRMDSDREEMAD